MIATYENILGYVIRQKRVSPFDLTQAFGCDWKTATSYLARMERESVLGPMTQGGVREVLPRQTERKATYRPKREAEPAAQKQLDDLERKILQLEEQVSSLKAAGRAVIEQREHWKARALEAEANHRPSEWRGNNYDRYIALKKIIARELHPDSGPGDGIERVVREALFKRIWPHVEQIDKG